MPVSYEASDLLRYSVSFSYVRYVRERFRATTHQVDFSEGATVVGIVNLDNGMFRVDRMVDGQVVSNIESSNPGRGSVIF